MMYWRRTNTCSFLFDENGKTMLTILKLPGAIYHITLVPLNERYQISAKSVEYAEWYVEDVENTDHVFLDVMYDDYEGRSNE